MVDRRRYRAATGPHDLHVGQVVRYGRARAVPSAPHIGVVEAIRTGQQPEVVVSWRDPADNSLNTMTYRGTSIGYLLIEDELGFGFIEEGF